MSRNKKLIIIILGVIALLMIILTVVLLIPDSSKKLTDKESNELLLFDKQGLIPEDITIKNDSGKFELLGYVINEPDKKDTDDGDSADGTESADGASVTASESSEVSHTLPDGTDIVYTMQEHPDYDLDKELVDGIAAQCLFLSASQIIDKSGSRYGEYGLSDPVTTVSIRYSSAEVIRFSIGDFAPDHMGVYVLLDGDRNVYLVSSQSVDSFFLDRLQLFDKNITGSISEVTGVVFSGSIIDGEVSITENNHACYPVGYITNEKERVPCNDRITQAVCDSVNNLKADRVAAIDVRSGELVGFGLDKPYQTITVKGRGGQSIKLSASESDEGKNFYVMTEGSSIIYQTNESSCHWYSLTGNELLSSSVFTVRSDEIKKLTTVVGKTKQVFDITRERIVSKNYYENDIITAKLGDKEVPYANIATFLMNVGRIARTDEVPPNTEGFKEILTLELSYVNDTEITDTFVLMRNSAGRTIAVLNGCLECCVDNNFADEIVKQTALISESGVLEELEMIVYDE